MAFAFLLLIRVIRIATSQGRCSLEVWQQRKQQKCWPVFSVAGWRMEQGKRRIELLEIRLLKTSIFTRSCLVESGSVPLLLKLLTWRDSSAQENAIAALLNLSKYPKSRAVMVENWGIELIVVVLNKGLKIEARQHAAATLFYLASNEEYGKMIGKEPEAIPSLIRLIKDGSDRGKKNGMVAMFGLLMQPENHRMVLAARAVPLLVDILKTCGKKRSHHRFTSSYSNPGREK